MKAQDWKAFFAAIAAATGTGGTADEAFKAYEKRAADIKARMPDVKVSVLRITPFGFQVYVDGPASYAPFAVMRDAGVERPAYETVDDQTIFKRPDWEGLAELDGDVLLYIVGNPYDDEARTHAGGFHARQPAVADDPGGEGGKGDKVDVASWMGFGGLASADWVRPTASSTMWNAMSSPRRERPS